MTANKWSGSSTYLDIDRIFKNLMNRDWRFINRECAVKEIYTEIHDELAHFLGGGWNVSATRFYIFSEIFSYALKYGILFNV